MTNMTWRDIRNHINTMDESKLDEIATVSLDDMVWMIEEGGTAGDYPINGVGDSFYIDEYYAYRNEGMKHITTEEILRGLKSGLIRLIDAEKYHGDGVACEIGYGTCTNWFYFAGQEGEDQTAAEYLRNVPIEDIAKEIEDALSDFEEDDYLEWGFYRTVIDEDMED